MKSYKLLTTSIAALFASVGGISAQTFYSDNFDVNTSALYTISQDADAEVLYNYDYSAVGIPSAPNSILPTTSGVRFRANIDATTGAAGISISPTAGNFTGDYRLRFDLWINANGPFPAGGAGSTQFGTAGVGTTGTSIQKTTTGTGIWFAVDGEGQSGIDFRAFRAGALEGPTSTVYTAPDQGGQQNRRNATNSYYHGTFPGGQTPPAAQTAAHPVEQTGALKPGTVGLAWREVVIEKIGDTVTWEIDGLSIATMTGSTFSGNNISIGHWDPFASITGLPAMNFSIVDNLVVEAIPEPSTYALMGLGAAGLAFFRRRK